MSSDKLGRVRIRRVSVAYAAGLLSGSLAVLALPAHGADRAPADAPRVVHQSAFRGYLAYDPDARSRGWREANDAATGSGHAQHGAADTAPMSSSHDSHGTRRP